MQELDVFVIPSVRLKKTCELIEQYHIAYEEESLQQYHIAQGLAAPQNCGVWDQIYVE